LISRIACVPEIVGAFAFRELGEEFADLGPQSRDRSFGGGIKEVLSVAAIMRQLIEETEVALSQASTLIKSATSRAAAE
jgi:hypothetical protein